jgi:hypothetical protein
MRLAQTILYKRKENITVLKIKWFSLVTIRKPDTYFQFWNGCLVTMLDLDTSDHS